MRASGPDGHVAFNCQGCDHFATTRLDQLNYASQAAAAGRASETNEVRWASESGGILTVSQKAAFGCCVCLGDFEEIEVHKHLDV